MGGYCVASNTSCTCRVQLICIWASEFGVGRGFCGFVLVVAAFVVVVAVVVVVVKVKMEVRAGQVGPAESAHPKGYWGSKAKRVEIPEVVNGHGQAMIST